MPEPDDSPDGESEATPGTAAAYIASLADELAQLARRNGLDALSYILDMARLEADQVSKPTGHKDGSGGSAPSNAPN